MSWIQATTVEKLESKGSVLFREEQRQIVMFWMNGEVFALDNRCPHQGYPLQQGTADGGECVLTCQWHNWKFDMKTGECVLGGDHVRTYPTRVEDGYVWLELKDPPKEEQQETILKGLREAMEKQQYGRMSRSVTKLVAAGLDPVIALEKAMEWTHTRFEYGMTHAHPALADWLQRYDDLAGDTAQQIVCITEALDHLAHDTLRHPHYPLTEDVQVFEGQAFLEAIEAEELDTSIALIRGALQARMVWDDLELWFGKAALAHYNDFGHALIYVFKVSQIFQRLPNLQPEALLFPLTKALCYSTREDLIPEFRRYASFFAETTEPASSNGSSFTEEERDSLFTASINQAMTWVVTHMGQHTASELYVNLLEASARNLLFYNTEYQDAYDKPVGQNIGWLHCTHAITFANALRPLATKYPELWRAGLLQMACFVGRNQSYTNREADVSEWFVDDMEVFLKEAWVRTIDHGILPPIFSAHLVKTWCAVVEEIEALPEANDNATSCQRYILASYHRYHRSPMKQKHARRAAQQSMALIMG